MLARFVFPVGLFLKKIFFNPYTAVLYIAAFLGGWGVGGGLLMD